MTRQQNSSSADFSILTASPGEEWTARINDRRKNYIREKNAETTVPLNQPHRSAQGTEVAAGRDVRCDGKHQHFV